MNENRGTRIDRLVEAFFPTPTETEESTAE